MPLIALTLSGSRWILFDVMMNPRNLPLDTPKNDLVGFISASEPAWCRTRFSGHWDGCLCCEFWLQCHQHSILSFFIDDHEKLYSWHVGKLHPHSSIWTTLLCNSIPSMTFWMMCASHHPGVFWFWLYPENPSMNDILSKPFILSIMTLVMGNRNSSLGHATLRSRKLMQTLIFPFFFSTGQY